MSGPTDPLRLPGHILGRLENAGSPFLYHIPLHTKHSGSRNCFRAEVVLPACPALGCLPTGSALRWPFPPQPQLSVRTEARRRCLPRSLCCRDPDPCPPVPDGSGGGKDKHRVQGHPLPMSPVKVKVTLFAALSVAAFAWSAQRAPVGGRDRAKLWRCLYQMKFSGSVRAFCWYSLCCCWPVELQPRC